MRKVYIEFIPVNEPLLTRDIPFCGCGNAWTDMQEETVKHLVRYLLGQKNEFIFCNIRICFILWNLNFENRNFRMQ